MLRQIHVTLMTNIRQLLLLTARRNCRFVTRRCMCYSSITVHPPGSIWLRMRGGRSNSFWNQKRRNTSVQCGHSETYPATSATVDCTARWQNHVGGPELVDTYSKSYYVALWLTEISGSVYVCGRYNIHVGEWWGGILVTPFHPWNRCSYGRSTFLMYSICISLNLLHKPWLVKVSKSVLVIFILEFDDRVHSLWNSCCWSPEEFFFERWSPKEHFQESSWSRFG